jgi:hypothetical protein
MCWGRVYDINRGVFLYELRPTECLAGIHGWVAKARCRHTGFLCGGFLYSNTS